MKSNMFLTTVMIMSMLLTSVNVNAQRRGERREHERTEYRGERRDKDSHMRQDFDRKGPRHKGDKYRRHDDRDFRHHAPGHDHFVPAPPHAHRPQVRPHGCKMVRCTPPRVRRGCYVPGWEGRVRYLHDGRWAYCVGGVWTYYDCYYNPYDFFCEPMPPRPVHHAPVVHVHHGNAGEVVAGVVAGTVIGCIIGAMAQ